MTKIKLIQAWNALFDDIQAPTMTARGACCRRPGGHTADRKGGEARERGRGWKDSGMERRGERVCKRWAPSAASPSLVVSKSLLCRAQNFFRPPLSYKLFLANFSFGLTKLGVSPEFFGFSPCEKEFFLYRNLFTSAN